MATLSNSAVVQAFLVDHRKFMRLLFDVGEALKAGDLEQARLLGAQLDEVAGPHIAFEEAVLYPALDRATGERSFVAELYDEHQAIVRALAELLENSQLDEPGRERITEAFTAGLEHAEHCGTLISRLSALDKTDQQEALDELKQLRSSGLKWTDLRKEA